jgi:large subunit ribosomal protein L25
MATSQQTTLSVEQREVSNSRAVRRLRREGKVPGVVYGGGEDPIAFAVDARVLRHALADAGAVIDLHLAGAQGSPVVVKELVRHPVTGATVHLDLLRVRLDRVIQSVVPLELSGVDDAPGVKEGGVLEQITREVTIEALPTDIPDALHFDASGLQIGDTITLVAVQSTATVTVVDDPDTVIATLTPPRLQLEDENEIEQETAVVGEGEAPAEGEASADGGGDSGSGDSDSE